MRRIMVLQARDIIALVDRIAVDGTVENDQLYAGLQRLDRTPIDEPTIFDRIDATRQGGWPPDGRWPSNPLGKDTQEARRDDL